MTARETEGQSPPEKTLGGGTPEGLGFSLIQTLFVFIVGETYLRLGLLSGVLILRG